MQGSRVSLHVIPERYFSRARARMTIMKLHLRRRYEEKLEKQEAHFRTLQSTLAERFERDRSDLLAEQKKREQEASAMLQQTQSRFQVGFRRRRKV